MTLKIRSRGTPARIAIAAAIIFVYMRASGIQLPRFGRRWLPMLFMALMGNVLPFQLVAWAQLDSPPDGESREMNWGAPLQAVRYSKVLWPAAESTS